VITDLYEKYKTVPSKELSELSPLSFILRKAELGKNLTTSEWSWLDKHQLINTRDIIKNQEIYRDSLHKEIKKELCKLKNNRSVYTPITTIPSIDSVIAFALYKVNAQERLSDTELHFIGYRYHKYLDFIERKKRYRITDKIPFGDSSENILSKIENKTPLNATDIKWICTNNAHSFLSSLKTQFSCLQNKYKAVIQEEFNNTSLSLFLILQKLDENRLPDQAETQYLIQNAFTETLEIIQKIKFSSLKVKYKATQIQENNNTHHLYKVLKKLDSGLPLPESDFNYLKKRKLHETIKLAYKKEADCLIHKIEEGYGLRPNDIAWCEEHYFEKIVFQWLKKDYGVECFQGVPESPFYAILKKLEAGNRLNDDDVLWLEGERLLRRSSKIYIAHHTLEALFYENEFLRTKDHWKFASASAQWRKAEKPKYALKLTDDLNFKQIKPAKLRAALLTTRGGALRDVEYIDEAKKCALEAIKHYPDSHNPYTLMGALCYDSGLYDEGDRWFKEAIKRGAKPNDQDSEIKRILRKKSNQKLINHLLRKDPQRFSWVKNYSHRPDNKNKQGRK